MLDVLLETSCGQRHRPEDEPEDPVESNGRSSEGDYECLNETVTLNMREDVNQVCFRKYSLKSQLDEYLDLVRGRRWIMKRVSSGWLSPPHSCCLPS